MHAKYPAKEIFVSEVGFSDKSDGRRPYWILDTARYIIEAKSKGIPIIGVLLWSLVNNFEWELGMSQKFGLFSEAGAQAAGGGPRRCSASTASS
jgi:beta-glucosidase